MRGLDLHSLLRHNLGRQVSDRDGAQVVRRIGHGKCDTVRATLVTLPGGPAVTAAALRTGLALALELVDAARARRSVEWVGGLGSRRRSLVRRAGFELVTAAQVARRGLRLRRGVRPVVVWLDLARGRRVELYLLAVQAGQPRAPRSAGPRRRRAVQESLPLVPRSP